ncbi:transposase [Streptomyces sp. NPDC005148]
MLPGQHRRGTVGPTASWKRWCQHRERPHHWARFLLLDGELAAAEPKKLRYRLLHVAARLTRGGRRLRLRISATWPWRHELTTAFHRLAALPRPAS